MNDISLVVIATMPFTMNCKRHKNFAWWRSPRSSPRSIDCYVTNYLKLFQFSRQLLTHRWGTRFGRIVVHFSTLLGLMRSQAFLTTVSIGAWAVAVFVRAWRARRTGVTWRVRCESGANVDVDCLSLFCQLGLNFLKCWKSQRCYQNDLGKYEIRCGF